MAVRLDEGGQGRIDGRRRCHQGPPQPDLTAAQYEMLVAAKARLDPTGAISDAGAVEILCRRFLDLPIGTPTVAGGL